MSLALDARQRAMLEEMGVRVWWPPALAPAPAGDTTGAARSTAGTPVPAGAAAAPDARPAGPPGTFPASAADAAGAPVVRVAPVAPPARAGALPPPAVAAAPADAARESGAAVGLDAARRLYYDGDGDGAPQGGWLLVADMPPGPDGRHGAPFAGDAGRLLDHMLRALRLHAGDVPVHLLRTHRATVGAAAAAGMAATATAAADGPPSFADSFAAQAAALAPRIVLALGPLAAQALLERADPLGKLRGRVLQATAVPGLPVVATYAPAYLLRNPADKARAWADLCLAAETAGHAGG